MHHPTPLDIDMHLRELHRQADAFRARRNPAKRGPRKATSLLAAPAALARRLFALRILALRILALRILALRTRRGSGAPAASISRAC